MHKWLGLVGLLAAMSGCGETPEDAPPVDDTMDMPTDPPPDTSDPADVAARVTVTAVDPALLAAVDEAQQGFGANTKGAGDGQNLVAVHVTQATDQAVRDAVSYIHNRNGNAVLVFDVKGPIAIKSPLPLVDVPFVTIEGNGATLEGSAFGSSVNALLDIRGHDIIVRHLRLRNAGDNLRAQGTGAHHIVFSHISSTGANDDGISIGYGAHDVTVQYCFLAGNTRSMFVKYQGTTDVSIHHDWLMKQWIRGPLIYDALADLRNLIVEDWTMWGSRFESGGHGNAVNSLFSLSDYAASIGGKSNSSLYSYQGSTAADVYTSGNVYQGQAQQTLTGTASQFSAPNVTTLSMNNIGQVRQKAGCLPRDAIDQVYIDTTTGWTTKDGAPFRP